MVNGEFEGCATDPEGYYVIKPLQPGLYDVKVSYTGYAPLTITGVRVSQNSISILNIKLNKSDTLPQVVVRPEVLMPADLVTGILPAKDFEHSPARGVDNKVITLPGIFQSDDGEELYFRGSRPEATEYYIDNVKVVGNHNIPNGAIDEITVYTGGIPARYGDVTGGVVVITTKSYNTYRHKFD